MQQKVEELLRQLLRGIQCSLWHVINATSLYNCNLQLATSLSQFEYETLLFANGIMVKHDNPYAFKKNRPDKLKDMEPRKYWY